MNKIRTYKNLNVFTLFLACWIVLLSTEVNVNLHFCQQQIKSFSLLGDAPNCHEMAANSSCHSKAKACKQSCSISKSNDEKKNCCTSKDVQLELDTDLPHFELSSLSFQTDIIGLPSVFIDEAFVDKPINLFPYKNYRPPPLISSYTKLYQQYLC